MKLSENEISEIVQLLRDADFDDLELEWDDIYVRIARRSALLDSASLQRPSTAVGSAQVFERAPSQITSPIQAAPPVGDRVAAEEAPEGVVEVRSSLMGTVYRSPQPGDPAFVEVGDLVEQGDTLCLLEVMKVFTALKADVAGTVERILINDGQLVEYGQVILWMRPA